MGLFNENISINTLLGAGGVVTGDLVAKGYARIDGDVKGNVEVSGSLIVGREARIQGYVKAASLITSGIIIGCVTVEDSVVLQETAIIIGDVTAKTIRIDMKAVLHGYCKCLAQEGSQETEVMLENFNKKDNEIANIGEL